MLPQGAVWNLTDYIPDLDGAPLQKRGGWVAGEALSAAASLYAVAYSPFSGDDRFCVIDNRSHLWLSSIGYLKQVLKSSPLLYWRLGESAGATTAKDASGHGRTATYGSGITLGIAGALSGDSDTAAAFNDTSNAVVSSNGYLPNSTPGASRTFMGWAYRLSGSSDDDSILTMRNGVFAPTSLKIVFGGQNVSLGSGTWAAAWPGYNQWVHWALTYNDSTRVAELFINGVSKGTQTLTTNLFGTSANTFQLGTFSTGFWNGDQDEFAVFGSILSATTITAIYNAGLSGWTDMGLATVPIQRPVFFNNLLIIPSNGAAGGASIPMKFDGTNTPSNLAGTVAGQTWAVTYKSRLVIAGQFALNFSAPLDSETWDVDSFIEPTHRIVGLAALSNMIAIFSTGHVERLRGTTPPSSTTDGDMTLEPLASEGCIDARSIIVYREQMIWANLNGVHISDGAAITNLVDVGGIRTFWDSLMRSYVAGWVFAGGVFKGRYILSITDDSGSFIAAFMCNLATKTWTFLNNVSARMFSESQGATAELLMAISTHNYVGQFSSCFDPEAHDSDGDGTPVEPSIEYPFFRLNTGSSRWRDLFLGVDLENVGAEIGELELWYTTTPDGDTYTQLLDDAGNPVTISGTSGYQRIKIPFNLAANGVGLKVVQSGASTKTALFDLEAVVREREGR